MMCRGCFFKLNSMICVKHEGLLFFIRVLITYFLLFFCISGIWEMLNRDNYLILQVEGCGEEECPEPPGEEADGLAGRLEENKSYFSLYGFLIYFMFNILLYMFCKYNLNLKIRFRIMLPKLFGKDGNLRLHFACWVYVSNPVVFIFPFSLLMTFKITIISIEEITWFLS